MIDEVQASARPIVLFIDEAHTLIGAGGAAGTGDAANLLKPALARGTLRTIAATTWAEYKKHIEKDAALTRRFQPVQVDEPEEAAASAMLRGMAATLEKHHGVQLLDEALAAAVGLSARYIQGRQLPDKAVSLLDTACARVAMSQVATPGGDGGRGAAHRRARGRARRPWRGRHASASPDRARGRARCRAGRGARRSMPRSARFGQEKALVERILALRTALGSRHGGAREAPRRVWQALQAELAALQGEAPLVLPGGRRARPSPRWSRAGPASRSGRMVTDELDAVLSLEQTLRGAGHRPGPRPGADRAADRDRTRRARQPGQAEGRLPARRPVRRRQDRDRAGARRAALRRRGPHHRHQHVGVPGGAHRLDAEGRAARLCRLRRGRRLTEAVRRKPYSVVLLDEVEKAHPDVHEMFFQVFDKGIMEDGEGRRIDFRNTLIILTSNVGSDLVMQAGADPDLLPEPDALAAALRPPLLKTFPAALLGRLTVIPYFPLGRRRCWRDHPPATRPHRPARGRDPRRAVHL